MNPANFPARKTRRRNRALDRLIAHAGREPNDRQATEIATLTRRVVAPAGQRSARTKKDRSAAAKFRRAA